MYIKTAQEKFAYDIGFDIGHSDSETQAKLLNGFFKPFNDHSFNSSMQMAYIVEDLDKNAKEMLLELSEYCK